MPLAISSLRLFKKMVNKTTFANSAKVEIAERIVFCDKITCIKSPSE